MMNEDDEVEEDQVKGRILYDRGWNSAAISQLLERIPIKHIEQICSPESYLSIIPICSVGILPA